MSLPPEQINIKRRREEEPVETLYIQSELHQTKRRFTDFVFQRVQISSHGSEDGSPSPSSFAAAQRKLLTPRSVSNTVFPATRSVTNRAAGAGATVPLVRATSPGAEIREERRLATARRENEERLNRALLSSPTSGPARPSAAATPSSGNATPGRLVASTSSGKESPASSAGQAQSLRRFQISRSNTPMSPLRSTGGGVQKRKGDGAVAVLVEKLRRTLHSRQASMVADVAARADDEGNLSIAGALSSEQKAERPRKRPVVNQAERRWREERKSAISAAKEHISQVLEREAQAAHQSNWEDESERLAKELEQVALELDGEMEVTATETDYTQPSGSQSSGSSRPRSVMPKPPLRYQPRTPNKHRAGGSGAEAMQGSVESREEKTDTPRAGSEDESDGEYVYDTYIRKPLPDTGLLTDPLVGLELDQEAWFRQHGIDVNRQDIGVIVITQEDEEYWENFAEEEDDEDRWDSEDADSNAENNPANDYPDEELSWDDEEDDPTAIYNKYRTQARSDDEEFDFDDSASEGRQRGGFGFRSHVESDEESW
ncbi:hypothetical protein BO94DRAFT_478979 [Aspergillus sclerotioniger CBS 115572]|uniref:Transcription factor Iwr1 domain-containing protein n=1 Tax=Aspergillus sclerotioniger CBS 115572 TaxID=1450535 RepID=A0A317V349_9EURO|nr:hypothetical protein BO94DRAFT_478979 [Aspergillus sclerotioniger CBS 115572]PWY67277.1 hypothetical protein BO94DRAFT_478979 [Aspergillus sclerotioniger CBS 115572]